MSNNTTLYYSKFSKARRSLSQVEAQESFQRKLNPNLPRGNNFPQVETFGSQRQFINELEDPPSSVRGSTNQKAEARLTDSFDYDDRINRKLFAEETFRGSQQKDSLEGMSPENKSRQSEAEQPLRINSETDQKHTSQPIKRSDRVEGSGSSSLVIQPTSSEKNFKQSVFTQNQLMTQQGMTYIKYETYIQAVSELKDQIYQLQLKDISNSQEIARLNNEIEKHKNYIVSLQLKAQLFQKSGKHSNFSLLPSQQETKSVTKSLMKGSRSPKTKYLPKKTKSIDLGPSHAPLGDQFEKTVKDLNAKILKYEHEQSSLQQAVKNVMIGREQVQPQVFSPRQALSSASQLQADPLSRSFDSITSQEFSFYRHHLEPSMCSSQNENVKAKTEKAAVDSKNRSGSPPSGPLPKYPKKSFSKAGNDKVSSVVGKIDNDVYKHLYQPRRMSLDLYLLEKGSNTPNSMAGPAQLSSFQDYEPNYSELHEKFNKKLNDISIASSDFRDQYSQSVNKASSSYKSENSAANENALLSVEQNRLKSSERSVNSSHRGTSNRREAPNIPRIFSFAKIPEQKLELQKNEVHVPERDFYASENYNAVTKTNSDKCKSGNNESSNYQSLINSSKSVNFNSEKAQEVLEYVKSMIRKK